MEHVTSPDGITVSYDKYGSGPPLVLVHGSLFDHNTAWMMSKPLLAQRFTTYAVARRGRGETTATESHSIPDQAADVATVVEAIGEPVFLLGWSFGAHVSLAAAALAPERIRKLVLYEPPWGGSRSLPDDAMGEIEKAAAEGDWDRFVRTFLIRGPKWPTQMVDAMQASPFWAPRIAEAPSSLYDFRALRQYEFDPARFAILTMPVLLLVGSESQRDNYVTDAMSGVLPKHQTIELQGQGHAAMVMAPQMFVEAVSTFLLGQPSAT